MFVFIFYTLLYIFSVKNKSPPLGPNPLPLTQNPKIKNPLEEQHFSKWVGDAGVRGRGASKPAEKWPPLEGEFGFNVS